MHMDTWHSILSQWTKVSPLSRIPSIDLTSMLNNFKSRAYIELAQNGHARQTGRDDIQ